MKKKTERDFNLYLLFPILFSIKKVCTLNTIKKKKETLVEQCSRQKHLLHQDEVDVNGLIGKLREKMEHVKAFEAGADFFS